MSRGGKRKGAGAPLKTPTGTHPVRCTDEGWTWLQSQALGKGHTSVGKWADAAGRKARRGRGTLIIHTKSAINTCKTIPCQE